MRCTSRRAFTSFSLYLLSLSLSLFLFLSSYLYQFIYPLVSVSFGTIVNATNDVGEEPEVEEMGEARSRIRLDRRKVESLRPFASLVPSSALTMMEESGGESTLETELVRMLDEGGTDRRALDFIGKKGKLLASYPRDDSNANEPFLPLEISLSESLSGTVRAVVDEEGESPRSINDDDDNVTPRNSDEEMLPGASKDFGSVRDVIDYESQRYVDCTVLGGSNAADAEDSSYDSDYEAEDSLGSTSVHPPLESRLSSSTHSDVSRTTSDTLAAEFAEYVTVQGQTPTQSPGYTARVEFALKLGYTERLVQAALQKLGPDPGQNELLAELIKLGASCSPKLSDSLEESDTLLDGETSTDEGVGRSNLGTSCLRPVVIDGSNVAMSHGNKEVFSCRGIKICVDWFKARGHREITVFVPKWRKEASRPDNPISDKEILGELERDRLLVFTPSRLVGGKRMVCYDDRYILRLAAEVDGIVVSNDNYRDLAQENPEFRRVVEERILMYSFVNDRFMPPDDPLGRSGPTLENFLRIGSKKTDPAPPCPYAKKCTFGNKCKFRHPERGPHPHKSVTERLVEHAQRHLQARGPSLSLPLNSTTSTTSITSQHQPLCKARSAAISSNVSQSLSSVPKSRSVENVTTDLSTSSPSIVYAQQMTSVQNIQGYVPPTTWATPRVNNSDGEPANMHRKLQRQLTLNPACDPRLYQLRRYHQQHTTQPTTQQQQQQHPQQTMIGSHPKIPQHRPLTRHASNESSYTVPISWEHEGLHQHVTRIASAPDSYRAWPPRNTNLIAPCRASRLGTSDPQLNLLPSSSSTTTNLHGAAWSTQAQDARRRLHYHLANIFPEEQVQAAMAINPHETDPQQICATILAMFPKN